MIDEVTENDIYFATRAELHLDKPGNKKLCKIILNGDYIERYRVLSSFQERYSQIFIPLLESLGTMDPPMR